MEDQQFIAITTEATAGLQDDPELRLDVQAELLSHLEDTAEQLVGSGISEEESITTAIKVFGSPLDLADTILKANTRRMRLRALLRLGVRVLLIPIALLVAFWIGVGGLLRVKALIRSLQDMQSGYVEPITSALPIFTSPWSRARERTLQQQLARMQGSSTNSEQLRALWEAHRLDPDAAVYYAYYANFLNGDGSKPGVRDLAFEREMRRGERIEPENALYNYRLAEYFLQGGILARSDQGKKNGKNQPDRVLDARKIELGLAEFCKGLAKPYLRFYYAEMLKKRYALLPSPRFTEDYLRRIQLTKIEFLPYLSQYTSLSRKVPGCARLLIARGRTQEALPLLNAWKPMCTQLVKSANTPLLLVYARHAAETMASESAEIYHNLGREAEAGQTLADYRRFNAPHDLYRYPQQEVNAEARTYRDHAAYIGSTILPVEPKKFVTLDDLKALRNHERTMLEELQISITLVLLTLSMLYAALRGCITLRKIRQEKAASILLLPPPRALSKIIGLGILLPLLLYGVYTQIPAISGRAYGMAAPYMFTRLLIEFAVMTVLLLSLPTTIAGRYLRHRCAVLGMPVPVPSMARKQSITSLIVLLGGLIGLIIAVFLLSELPGNWSLPAGLSILVISLLLLVVLLPRIQRWKVPYRLFFGITARSLVPVYALSVILLAVTVQPYLLYQEAKWLSRDQLFFAQNETNNANPLVTRVTMQLRAEMLRAIEPVPVHPAEQK